MKYGGTYFDVIRYKGTGSLCLTNKDSFEGVVENIKAIEEKAKANGYDNNERWIIVRVKWKRVFDDDGVFMYDEEKRTAVALYDNGAVKMWEKI